VLQCVGNGSRTLSADVVTTQAECGGVWRVSREKREKREKRERRKEKGKRGSFALTLAL
jgi:hypothetical protein